MDEKSQKIYSAGSRNPDDWDDSLILDIFYDSIASFNNKNENTNDKNSRRKKRNGQNAEEDTKNSGKNKSKRVKWETISKDDLANQSMASPWIPVSKPLPLLLQGKNAMGDESNTETEGDQYNKQGVVIESECEPGEIEEGEIQENGSQTIVHQDSNIDTAFHEMLSLWYQAGYATGRYQTLLEIQNKTNH